MKKALIIGLLLFTGLPVFADTGITVDSYSRAPSSASFQQQPVVFHITASGVDPAAHYAAAVLHTTGGGYQQYGCKALSSFSSFTLSFVPAQGDYDFIAVNTYPDASSCDTNSWIGSGTLEGDGSATVMSVLAPPAELFDTPVIMASVVASVQQSGSLLWPLFVFVGILIAFYIAEKVGDFIRKSVGARAPARGKAYEEEYTPEQVGRITDKIKELGDRDSFDE